MVKVGCSAELIRIQGFPTSQGCVLMCTQECRCHLYDLAGLPLLGLVRLLEWFRMGTLANLVVSAPTGVEYCKFEGFRSLCLAMTFYRQFSLTPNNLPRGPLKLNFKLQKAKLKKSFKIQK